MIALYLTATTTVFFQLSFVLLIIRNYRYILDKSRKPRKVYRPKTALIVPCKGLDIEFERNIQSFYHQDYENYELLFVTESADDPAYEKLEQIKNAMADKSKALDVRLLVAGIAENGSQKLHNLLCAYRNISDGVIVMAFADSDAYIAENWLEHIVHPLRKSKIGVTSGYRWFVPCENNIATLALSAVNAKVAQNLGATPFNQAWGGSMAVRVDTFESLGIEEIWKKAISDDLTLSRAARKAGKRIIFVPACFVASYEKITWRGFLEFGRRQFLITRVTLPGTWWFGVLSGFFSVFGFWGLAIIAAIVGFSGSGCWLLFAVCSAIFLACQELRAVIRQKMIFKLLPKDAEKMKVAAAADIIGNPIWSLILLALIISSAVGRSICWRGVKYRLKGATEVIRVEDKD